VTVKVLSVGVESDGVRVTLGIGTNARPTLDTGWTGEVLCANSGKPLVGGTLEILNVGRTQVQAKVKLTVDTLNQNREVRLTPPPPPAAPRC
jgi:hypothetical protein